jgi:DNA mismatch repair protein MutS
MRQEIDLGQKRYAKLSLLWEDYQIKDYIEVSKSMLEDLNIQTVETYFLEKFKLNIGEIIHQVPTRIEDTLYRQEIMTDFSNNPQLFDTLLEYGQKSHHLMSLSKFAFEREATIYNLIKRMDDVEQIRTMLEAVFGCINKSVVTSRGLLKYKHLLSEILDSRIYEAFMADIRRIKDLEEGVKSLKIGINLDDYLQPIEAILLEISDEEFQYSRFGKRLGYYMNYGIQELKLIPRKLFARETVAPPNSLNTLEKTIEPATMQLIKFCDQFTMKILEVLSVLYHDLPYYQVGVELYRYFQEKRFSIALPTWEKSDTIFCIQGMFNLNLGFSMPVESVVTNDFIVEEKERITILTGANRGGKTTYSQGIVHVLWLAQCGFYVPAKVAKLTFVDQLLLHYAKEETQHMSYGRLGEECERFRALYESGSVYSFYSMNESFAGTSYQESLQIAVESLRAIAKQGGIVVFNTHLHELVDELEKYIPPHRIKSLIAGKSMSQTPYKIEPGRPLGKSYALEIAQKYGMTFEQLME